jgi:hypothetical protein
MEFITTPNPNAIKIETSHNLEVGTVIESHLIQMISFVVYSLT